MKKYFAILFATVMVFVTIAQAQAPHLMSFQSVIRNSSGTLVTNHSVGVKISILQGSISGAAVYTETLAATTNVNGLVTLQIGGGTVVSGTFSGIDWSAGPYYLKSEIDPTGGTSYAIAGTTQLLSVAYALYAEKSGTPGPTGATGAQGIQGVAGPTGATGTSITNTRVVGDSLYVTLSTGQTLTAGYVRGATGVQGLQGLQGLVGATGTQGIQGVAGSTGATGTSITNTRVVGDSLYVTLSTGQILTAGYVRGATGAQGPQGLQGQQGIQGLQGLTGAIGATGAQGIQGLTGAAGTSITNASVVGDSLYVTLSSGQKLTAGYVRGSTGIAGINGNTILNGTIDPIIEQGNVGDFYLNTTSNSLFGPKTSNGWGSNTSLIPSSGINNTQTFIFTSNGF